MQVPYSQQCPVYRRHTFECIVSPTKTKFTARTRETSALLAHAAAASPNSTPAAGPLVVVGSVNADLVLSVDRLPQPGETIGACSMQFFPGGKGANQAAAAARLSYPTYFLGQVGTDSSAAPLRAALKDAGVQLDYLNTVEGASGTAVILLQKQTGENSIIIVGGANQDVAAWQLTAEAQQLIAGAGAVLLQREIPESVNIQVAQAAAAAGVPVLLDAGGVDAPLSPALLSHLTIISPNETELQRLTGLPTETQEQLLTAAAALQATAAAAAGMQQQHRGLQVLLKLGTAGSMMVGDMRQQVIRQPAIMAPRVVDTTGAGDCFTAAFMVSLLEGQSAEEAMKFAAAAASICVSRAGAMPSLPTRPELDKLLDSLV